MNLATFVVLLTALSFPSYGADALVTTDTVQEPATLPYPVSCSGYATVDPLPPPQTETDQAGHGRAFQACKDQVTRTVCLVQAYDECSALGGTPSQTEKSISVGRRITGGYWSVCAIQIDCALP